MFLIRNKIQIYAEKRMSHFVMIVINILEQVISDYPRIENRATQSPYDRNIRLRCLKLFQRQSA